ncbi:Guanylate cyclase [Seminavis robusta]|uniref:Guanylate cyclase n=1 Tax=Seminavis robusta TaxID=568900 RepID=A0A9N8D801_9STRA|nr:Guanylate cyclase [Seminavis robusta]|eukprot:Sro25_g017270.1 Guanylate cyclase (806) ;mRNA; f:142222-144725
MRRAVVNQRPVSTHATVAHQKQQNFVAAVAVAEDNVRDGKVTSTGTPQYCRRSSSKKESTISSMILRMVRLGSVAVVLLYVWLSSGAIATTISTNSRANSIQQEYDVASKGKVSKTSEGTSYFDEQEPVPPSEVYKEASVDQRQDRSSHSSSLQDERRQQQQQHDMEARYTVQSAQTPSKNLDKEDGQCSLYLAPSTIPGAGLGMFSSVHRAVGEPMGTGEVIVPLVELHFYSGQADLFNPFSDYYWRGREKGLHGIVAEHRSNSLQGYVPGVDAAINCNLALINVDMSGSQFDDGNLSRYHHPMAGSMSPYHSTPSLVRMDIPAGGELFKFYGDQWFVARQDKFGLIPLSDDYPVAQNIINKFDRIQKRHFPSNEKLKEDLWSLVKDDIGMAEWESRIMNALPQSVGDAQKAAQNEIASLHQAKAVRSVDYLRQHGRCVDSIRPGPSTLPSRQGGRGAFAKRNYAKGSIITGTPLIHVPNRELLTMFRMERNNTDPDTGEETWLRHVDEIVNHQMMLNYCYGHHQSTMLLCPYGSGVNYINHNQTLANVRIQWAPNGTTSHNSSWLTDIRVEDLEWVYDTGLAFDYIATKDIKESDELFLDYGDEFEKVIAERLATWRPESQLSFTASDFYPAEAFKRHASTKALRTEMEQKQLPYPDNIEIRCHSALVDRSRRSQQRENADEFEFHWDTREIGFPCRILERKEAEGDIHDEAVQAMGSLYTVELKLPLEEVGLQYKSDTFTYVQKKDVARSAISFFNKPYTTDLFLPNTFRKDIGIPDDMFPSLWKNKLPTQQKVPDKQVDFP